MSQYKPYSHNSSVSYADLELDYSSKGYYLNFLHIPSGRNVQFKALLNTFGDRYVSNWNSDDVYGRMDPIERFRNVRRTIALGWDLVASSIEEARDNLDKISLLISMQYPSYSETESNAGSIAAAPLFKFGFANLIQDTNALHSRNSTDTNDNSDMSVSSPYVNSGLVGRMDGISFEPVLEDGFFDISTGILYPKFIRLSFNYTVIHTHSLGWDTKGNPRKGFENFPYGREQKIDRTNDINTTSRDIKEDDKRLNQKESQENQVLSRKSI